MTAREQKHAIAAAHAAAKRYSLVTQSRIKRR